MSAAPAVRQAQPADPVALAPGKAISLALPVERHRCPLQERGVDVLERLDADDRVDVAVDPAGDNWDDAAVGAHVKLCGLRPESIRRHVPGISDVDREGSRRAGRPHATVLDAERARAGPGRDFRRLGLPVQLEGDVTAVTGTGDEHGRSRECCLRCKSRRRLRKTQPTPLTVTNVPAQKCHLSPRPVNALSTATACRHAVDAGWRKPRRRRVRRGSRPQMGTAA